MPDVFRDNGESSGITVSLQVEWCVVRYMPDFFRHNSQSSGIMVSRQIHAILLQG